MMDRAVQDWHTRTPVASPRATVPYRPAVLPTIQRYTLTNTPLWHSAQPMTSVNLMRAAHFGIMKRGAVKHEGGTQEVTLYIATARDAAKKTPQLSITITQDARSVSVSARDASGEIINGAVPQRVGTKKTTVPLLSWWGDTEVLYSVLVQNIERVPHVVVIMHTRTAVGGEGNGYKPLSVQTMLERYCASGVLADRMHGYLDDPAHMQLLPFAYASSAYALPVTEELMVTWSSPNEGVVVTPREL